MLNPTFVMDQRDSGQFSSAKSNNLMHKNAVIQRTVALFPGISRSPGTSPGRNCARWKVKVGFSKVTENQILKERKKKTWKN